MDRRFKVILEWNEDGGGYTVTVPALPGCITEGDTVEEAIEGCTLRLCKKQAKAFPLMM